MISRFQVRKSVDWLDHMAAPIYSGWCMPEGAELSKATPPFFMVITYDDKDRSIGLAEGSESYSGQANFASTKPITVLLFWTDPGALYVMCPDQITKRTCR